MFNKKIIIFGGGTMSHVTNHLALCAPAYGSTAKKLAALAREMIPNMDVELKLTKLAGGDLETNEDVDLEVKKLIQDNSVRVIIMNAALVDFDGRPTYFAKGGKYITRLKSDNSANIVLEPKEKIINQIRKTRKDIFLVGFKATCNFNPHEQYLAGLNLLKKNSCNLVFANDTKRRLNMIICPEESRYHETTDRNEALVGLIEMIKHRTQLVFTRSTVIDGKPISWDSDLIPATVRTVVNYCISKNAYKPFNGVTAGHFAIKLNDTTFLSSIRKTNFNEIEKVGMVKVVTDGPDTVLAYGAKPSVGGQSQRIVFRDHREYDSIVHFHCPIKPGSEVPTVSQYEFECGSMACGNNTSVGLKRFGNLSAVYLDQHGPNIVFHSRIDPQEVINFIEANFDLNEKTGGMVY